MLFGLSNTGSSAKHHRYIKNTLLEKVKQAPFFTVLSVEAVDAGTKEQMPIILRFVDANRVIREEFMDFIHCDHRTTGEALVEKITNKLQEFGLDLAKRRGQGYDGAGNMSGRIDGCAAVVNRQYPKALYIHCVSHAFNLCVMPCTRLTCLQHAALNEVCLFFCYFPKQKKLGTWHESSSNFQASYLDSHQPLPCKMGCSA